MSVCVCVCDHLGIRCRYLRMYVLGTSLPELPRDQWAVWKAGSVVEAEWAIYANHGKTCFSSRLMAKGQCICVIICVRQRDSPN